jgi:membrane protein
MTTARQAKTGLSQPIEPLIKAAKDFNEDDGLYYAAALTFQVFFSLFPFLFFVLALLWSLNIPGFWDWLLEQGRAVFPDQPGIGMVEQSIEQVRSQAQSGLISFSWLIITLWSTSYGVRTIMHALNVAYDVEERPEWKEYALSILYAILLAVLIIVALGLLLIGSQMAEWFTQQLGIGSVFVTLWGWLRIPTATLLLIVFLALVYYLFSNLDQPFRVITLGTVVAVIVWLGASLGFSFYVNNFASYSTLYGNLAAIIVLQLYIYISASIILLGAEVNEQICRQFTEEGQDGDEESQKPCPSHG